MRLAATHWLVEAIRVHWSRLLFAAVFAASAVFGVHRDSPAVASSAIGAPAGEIVFTRSSADFGRSDLYVVTSDGSRPRLLARNAANAAVSPDGRRIAFVRGRAIWVMRRDGSAQWQVVKPSGNWGLHPAWSPDGRSLYFERSRYADSSALFTIRADGTDLRRLTSGLCDVHPAPSPDGRLIAYETWDECERGWGGSIEAVTTTGNPLDLRLVFPLGDHYNPAWSPDGRRLAYGSGDQDLEYREGSPDGIYVSSSKSSHPRRLAKGNSAARPAWSPDGSAIAFDAVVIGDHYAVFLVRSDGTGLRRLTRTSADDTDAAWLPALPATR
jgi:TolB protein